MTKNIQNIQNTRSGRGRDEGGTSGSQMLWQVMSPLVCFASMLANSQNCFFITHWLGRGKIGATEEKSDFWPEPTAVCCTFATRRQ